MSVTIEEEIVLLYALYKCGGHPSKSRATEFIMTNHLFKEHSSDYDAVATDESRIENRIAWTRQNLKMKQQLVMPERGTWAITPTGVERLKTAAIKSLVWQHEDLRDIIDISWERFSPDFLECLSVLGQELTDKKTQTK